MKKYLVTLGSYDLSNDIIKPQIVELEDNKAPTAKNLIYQHLLKYYFENKEELGFPEDTKNIKIGLAAFEDANAILDKLFYFKCEEVV